MAHLMRHLQVKGSCPSFGGDEWPARYFSPLLEPEVLAHIASVTQKIGDDVRSPGPKALWVDVPGLGLDAATASEREARNRSAALARWENEGGAVNPSYEA